MARGHIRAARSAAGAEGKAWTVTIELPVGADGKRRQRTATVHGNRREADRERTRLQREADTCSLGDPGRLTVGEYLTRWLEDSAALEVAPQTLSNYRASTARWQALIGRHRLDRLSPLHVQAACKALLEEGLQASTVRRHHMMLHRALRKAVDWRLLSRNPAAHVALPRQEPRQRLTFTQEQATRFLAAANADRDGAMAILALGLGLRIGECLALCWSDVDLDAGTARIRHSMQRSREVRGTKTGRERTITLPEFVVIYLREHPGEGLVCGPAHSVNSTETMRRICKAAGVPVLRFHDLRHTHATLLLSQHADLKAVSERLGHRDVRITLAVYYDVQPQTHEDIARQLDEIMRERK